MPSDIPHVLSRLFYTILTVHPLTRQVYNITSLTRDFIIYKNFKNFFRLAETCLRTSPFLGIPPRADALRRLAIEANPILDRQNFGHPPPKSLTNPVSFVPSRIGLASHASSNAMSHLLVTPKPRISSYQAYEVQDASSCKGTNQFK